MNNNGTLDDEILLQRLMRELGESDEHIKQLEKEVSDGKSKTRRT